MPVGAKRSSQASQLRLSTCRSSHFARSYVLASIAMKADPLAGLFAHQSLLAAPEIDQIVGIDQRRGRVDQIVVRERAPVDWFGRALEAEMPELSQCFVRSERPDSAQLLKRGLNGEARINQNVMDVAGEDFFGFFRAVLFPHDVFIEDRIWIGRTKPKIASEQAMPIRICPRLQRRPARQRGAQR